MVGPFPDPIFWTIEQHKRAFHVSQMAGRLATGTEDASPEYPARDAVANAARERCDTAAMALTSVQPTTLAGALALLEYVEAFNAGAFAIEPFNWESSPICWPKEAGENGIDLFPYLLTANVRRAIAGTHEGTPIPLALLRTLGTVLTPLAEIGGRL